MKKCCMILICLMLISTMNVYAVENNNNNIDLNENPIEVITVNWYQVAWKILSYTQDYWFNRSPSYTVGDGYISISSGDVDFNNGTYGPTAYHNISVTNEESYIEMWAQTGITHWLDKIALILNDPYGDEVKSLAATHNQYLYYGLDENGISTGTYKAEYVSTDTFEWDLWLSLTDYSSVANNLVTGTNKNGESLQFYRANDKMYPVSKSITEVPTNFVDTTLTMSELSSQFYDEETNTYVYNLKNFNIGDHIQFEDVILDIYYDEDRNATIIVFKDFDQDNVSWAFNGDLEKEYSIGDILKLNLTVVEEYSDDNYTFETINYIKEGLEMLDKNIYPSIDKYLD